MSEMTLEQVRDWHRKEADNAKGTDAEKIAHIKMHMAMCDAIDAHLTRATVQVTDEMVERACEAYEGAYHWEFQKEQVKENSRTSIRRALESARLAQPVVACDACESTGVFDTDGNGPYDCYACGKKAQRQPQAAQSTISEALNTLEEWALAGNQLHGDDVHRFRAVADKIAPQAAQGGDAVAEVVKDVDAIGDKRLIWYSTAAILDTPIGTKLYPHPAERAAVPDDDARQILRELCDMYVANQHAIGVYDFVSVRSPNGRLADSDTGRVWLRALALAAPTLAGKDGAK